MAADIGDMICGIQQVSETAGTPGGKFPIPVDGEAGRIGLISFLIKPAQKGGAGKSRVIRSLGKILSLFHLVGNIAQCSHDEQDGICFGRRRFFRLAAFAAVRFAGFAGPLLGLAFRLLPRL